RGETLRLPGPRPGMSRILQSRVPRLRCATDQGPRGRVTGRPYSAPALLQVSSPGDLRGVLRAALSAGGMQTGTPAGAPGAAALAAHMGSIIAGTLGHPQPAAPGPGLSRLLGSLGLSRRASADRDGATALKAVL